MKRVLRRIFLVFAAFVMAFTAIPPVSVSADSSFRNNNDVLYINPDAATCTNETADSTTVSGDGNVAKMWNYLVGKGLTDMQAAGVLGNIQQESGFSPFRQEGAARWPLGGYGIVQWTAGRRTAIVDKMRAEIPAATFNKFYSPTYGGAASKENGYVPKDVPVEVNDQFLGFELDYLYSEATTRKVRSGYGPSGATEWEALKAASSIRAASDIWLLSFERPADQSDSHAAKRAEFGQAIYDEMKGQAASETPSPLAEGGDSESLISVAKKGLIFIDPGHGADIAAYTDEPSKLRISDRQNQTEATQMLEVARRIKTGLESSGFTVALSREGNESVNPRQRVEKALGATAVLGISLHTTSGDESRAVPQQVGAYREYNGTRVEFKNTDTVSKSGRYNNVIASSRSGAESRQVGTVLTGNFTHDTALSSGNIPLVSLFADTIPWSYNEFAIGSADSMTEEQIASYAQGIIDGVNDAFPSTTTGGCDGETGIVNSGDLSATTLAYAWPKYRGNDTESKPEYKEAIKKAKIAGQYIGACEGVDCGAFVSRLLIDSGFEPKYNYDGKGGNTISQEKWMRENWELLGTGSSIDTGTLQPGDVAINAQHTFVFVGDIPGFDSTIASASMCQRAPVAGQERIADGAMRWYRKK